MTEGVLSRLTSRAAVEGATEEYDELGQEKFLNKYGYGQARTYLLHYHERLYDSKAIAGVAYGFEHPKEGPLKSTDFRGGIDPGRAAHRLQELGFEIQTQG